MKDTYTYIYMYKSLGMIMSTMAQVIGSLSRYRTVLCGMFTLAKKPNLLRSQKSQQTACFTSPHLAQLV